MGLVCYVFIAVILVMNERQLFVNGKAMSDIEKMGLFVLKRDK